MKLRSLTYCLILCSFALTPARAQTKPDSAVPHLEKRGAVTQLIVDGKPYLVLGGELANTASSSLEYMKPVWPRLAKMNLNTVLTAVAWAWVEPEEGKYDFSVVDGLLEGARKENLHIVFLWFGRFFFRAPSSRPSTTEKSYLPSSGSTRPRPPPSGRC